MSIGSRIKGRAIATYLGPTGRGARDLLAEARRRLARQPVRLELFHDPADPWSYLAAQAVDRLARAYPGLELAVHVVGAPAADVDPVPALRARHAVRDARELAAYWDVDFDGKREMDPALLRKAASALVVARPATEQLAACLELGAATWRGDGKQVDALLGRFGAEAQVGVSPALATAYGQLRERGHYQGAMLAYRGQWYWGIDRIAHLEAAIARDAGVAPLGVVSRRPEAERGPLPLGPADAPLALEVWFSFRSPYSYLALERLDAVLGDAAVAVRLRPVPPMIERGLAVPRVKRLYIAMDAQREADRLGIPFGALCELAPPAVAACLAIAKWAIERGQGLAFARSALRGAWSEAMDLTSYVDLRRVVERAGLPWDGARAAMADPDAPAWATANATDLGVAGLWGVPSFRIGDLATWGQDRLELIADRIRRHRAATAAA